jgi:hypothetical protein
MMETETNIAHRFMTDDERLDTMYQAALLFDEGKDEEASRMLRSVPLKPELAKIFKDVYGADYLAGSGFNLLEADKTYGKDWLYN